MKHISTLVAVLITLLFIGCQNDKKIENQEVTTTPEKALISELDTFYLGSKLVHVEKIKKSDFEAVAATTVIDTSETKNLLKDNALVKRVGDSLIIKTNAKDLVLLDDDNDEDDADSFASYSYHGFLENANQFLVLGTYYEAYDYLLIDRQTGDITHLWGLPVVSPNGKHIIAGNTDLVAAFTPNGIQLFENAPKPKLIAERELQTWGPEEIKWMDNKTLLVKASVSDPNSENLERPEYFKMKLPE